MEVAPLASGQFGLILNGVDCAAVSVTIPGTSFSQNYTLKKGEMVNLTVPSSFMLSGSSIFSTGVIVISSNSSISVISKVWWGTSYEWSYVYPVDLLDNQYYIITPSSGFTSYAQFAILSLDQTTSVTVTLSGGSVTFQNKSWSSGSSTSFQLSPYNAAQFKLLNGDLSGSFIQADKPIAVLSGRQVYQLYTIYTSGYIFEQLLPVSRWERSFVLPPLSVQSRKNDLILVMASQSTNLKVYDGSAVVASTSLSRGNMFTQAINTSSLWIVADNDVMVIYVCSGSPFVASTVKPFMANVMSTAELETSQVVYAPSSLTTNLLIVTVSGQSSAIMVDGISLPPNITWNETSFKTLKYTWVEVTVSPNSHIVQQLLGKDVWVMAYMAYSGNTASIPRAGNTSGSFNFYGGGLVWSTSPNKMTTPTTSTVLTSKDCQGDSADIYLMSKPLSWWDALRYCRQHYTDLVSVPDISSQNQVAAFMKNSSVLGNGVWIGLRRHKVWGYLYWMDGQPTDYMNWGDGEPSDPLNNLCTLISPDKNFTWSDQCCNMKLSFICY